MAISFQPDLVSQVIVRRMKKAGVDASIHSLRHSHAAILYRAEYRFRPYPRG
ncbi:MAG TPA: hypothetical protein VMR62_18570 [Bryobacteraceae bacterium]|jgi:integrase|nr:hypothetical protein [Bryobacteraceae bacterium]